MSKSAMNQPVNKLTANDLPDEVSTAELFDLFERLHRDNDREVMSLACYRREGSSSYMWYRPYAQPHPTREFLFVQSFDGKVACFGDIALLDPNNPTDPIETDDVWVRVQQPKMFIYAKHKTYDIDPRPEALAAEKFKVENPNWPYVYHVWYCSASDQVICEVYHKQYGLKDTHRGLKLLKVSDGKGNSYITHILTKMGTDNKTLTISLGRFDQVMY